MKPRKLGQPFKVWEELVDAQPKLKPTEKIRFATDDQFRAAVAWTLVKFAKVFKKLAEL